jgi:hypothetical protein
MIPMWNGSDSDSYVGHLRRHRWYPKRATQVFGMKLRIALLLQLLELAKAMRSSRRSYAECESYVFVDEKIISPSTVYTRPS